VSGSTAPGQRCRGCDAQGCAHQPANLHVHNAPWDRDRGRSPSRISIAVLLVPAVAPQESAPGIGSELAQGTTVGAGLRLCSAVAGFLDSPAALGQMCPVPHGESVPPAPRRSRPAPAAALSGWLGTNRSRNPLTVAVSRPPATSPALAPATPGLVWDASVPKPTDSARQAPATAGAGLRSTAPGASRPRERRSARTPATPAIARQYRPR
jgi:hypothetical protein